MINEKTQKINEMNKNSILTKKYWSQDVMIRNSMKNGIQTNIHIVLYVESLQH